MTSLFLAVIFMAVTTGISISVHTCSGSNKTEITLYEKGASCCCGEKSSMPNDQQGFDPSGCCKSNFHYIKSDYSGFPVMMQNVTELAAVLCVIQNISITGTSETPVITIRRTDHPPPLSGTSLVYFLHQIRIPYHSC